LKRKLTRKFSAYFEKEGGFLIITIQNDTISKIERRYVKAARKKTHEQDENASSKAYIILATSPP
jgi:hypothetical protein